jgi:nitrogenase-stabilizing/protective protein
MFADVPLRDPMGSVVQEKGVSVSSERPDVLAAVKAAGSAEEIFALLGVAYDPKVLNVTRLHILKRMGEYLEQEDLENTSPDVAAARCKAVLERAYADFVASSPLQERVFKVLKEAGAPQPPESPEFVPLDRLQD